MNFIAFLMHESTIRKVLYSLRSMVDLFWLYCLAMISSFKLLCSFSVKTHEKFAVGCWTSAGVIQNSNSRGVEIWTRWLDFGTKRKHRKEDAIWVVGH